MTNFPNQFMNFLDHLNSRCKFNNSTFRFTFKPGKKYTKIIDTKGSVHCFIDNITGDIFKPASYSAPAKGIRYNLEKDYDLLINNADIYGSYLYCR